MSLHADAADVSGPRPTYLLVDGENIDATLGLNVLGRRPNPDERPRWDRVLDFVRRLHAKSAAGKTGKSSVRGLFFLNASNGNLPMNFVQALLAMDFRPIPLSGQADEKVVDIGIQRTLAAIRDWDRKSDELSHVILTSHDGDFIPQVESLFDSGHRVTVLAFREFLNMELAALQGRGLEVFDLETDVNAFNAPLPRIRVIALEDFNPLHFL